MKLPKIIPALAVGLCLSTPAFALFGHSSDKTNEPAAVGSFSAAQVGQIQKIVHDYIVQNPQVLIEAGKTLQKQALSQADQTATNLVRHNAQQLFHDPNAIVLGNPKGKITLVEFYDFQCPHCRDTASAITAVLKKNTDLRVVFKDLPIFGKYSQQAAKASLAAYAMDKSKYLAFHNNLFKANVPFDAHTIETVAKQSGYDYAKLSAAMQQQDFQNILQQNFDLAKTLLQPTINMVATPAIFVAQTNTSADSTAPVGFLPGQATQAQLQALIKKVQG